MSNFTFGKKQPILLAFKEFMNQFGVWFEIAIFTLVFLTMKIGYLNGFLFSYYFVATLELSIFSFFFIRTYLKNKFEYFSMDLNTDMRNLTINNKFGPIVNLNINDIILYHHGKYNVITIKDIKNGEIFYLNLDTFGITLVQEIEPFVKTKRKDFFQINFQLILSSILLFIFIFSFPFIENKELSFVSTGCGSVVLLYSIISIFRTKLHSIFTKIFAILIGGYTVYFFVLRFFYSILVK